MPCTKHLSEKQAKERIKKAEVVQAEQILGPTAILGR
jgi:hypothetical protein